MYADERRTIRLAFVNPGAASHVRDALLDLVRPYLKRSGGDALLRLPSFDLQLTTAAGNYDITINVTGTPGDTETTLTSDPTLPEPDIMAMLVTGRTLDDMRGEEFEVAREQVLSYMAGRVGSNS